MKKTLAIVLALTMILSLALLSGCGKEQPASDKPVVYFCISHMTNAWAATASESMKAEAAAQGVDLTVYEANKDINTQVGQIEMAVTNGAQVIIIEPVSAEGVLAAVKAAEAAGVHVIIYNQNISDPSAATCFVGVSNEDMGYMEMKAACEAIGGKGNVALLLGPRGSEGQIGRSAGYTKALAEYPDVTVVFEEDAEWTTEQALTLVENWISTGTEINAVVAQNDNMALGAVKALEDAGIQGVPAYGVDAVDDALTAIKDGRLTATVDQATPLQSKLAIEVAIKLAKGEAVEAQYLAEPTLIDANNVAEYVK
jgi:ribose transport system substrate-binding protein/inositol transport system substrate-binding protein